MRRKLLLINPVNPRKVGLTVNTSARFPPLGLGIVAALTPDDWEIEILDENFESFRYKEADLVGLTAFTAAARRAYEIAALYRKKGVTTVLGGIHASILPEEALQYVDTVVVGEAESVWPELIKDFERGRVERVYRGEWLDLKEMVIARHDLFHPGYMFGSVQTSRGCPFDCEFCSVPSFNGRRYRRRPVEDVLRELKTIRRKMVNFVDDNIIGYGEDASERAIALFKGMIDRGIDKEWYCASSMNFADSEEMLAYAAKSGCRLVFLGVEAEDRNALVEMNKSINLKTGVDSYQDVFRRINRHGIAVVGAFIYGLDSDTPSVLRSRTDYIAASGIDVVQITYLTALPGTRLFQRLKKEGRLLYTDFPQDWDRHDMTEVTHRPRSMEPEELADIVTDSVRQLYSRQSLWRRFIRTCRATGSFTTGLWACRANLNYRKVALEVLHSRSRIQEINHYETHSPDNDFAQVAHVSGQLQGESTSRRSH